MDKQIREMNTAIQLIVLKSEITLTNSILPINYSCKLEPTEPLISSITKWSY